MRHLLAIAAGISIAWAPASAHPGHSRQTHSPEASFAGFSDRVIDEYLKLNPVVATQLGDHRFDSILPDASSAGRARQRAFAERGLAELARYDRAKLSREQQVDAILLENQFRYILFTVDRLQDWAWDPLTYASTAGSSLFTLSSREFAPTAVRLRSATGRLESLPNYLAQSRASLVAARVPKIHAETAANQNIGLVSLIDGFLLQKDALPSTEQGRLVRAAQAAKSAVGEHQRWLEGELVPKARGNERIGAALYDVKLRLALNSPLSRREIRQRAFVEIQKMRSEMYRVAAGMLKDRAGSPPAPPFPTRPQQQAVIEAALAIVNTGLIPRDEVIPFTRQTMQEAIAFAKEKDLISFPKASFNVIEMPHFARGVAGAYADMPGPLELDQRGFYAVEPIPSDWTAEQIASYQREYNKWATYELTLHEAVPGHLLQLAHSNRHKSRLRGVFQSGPMIEGWACYGEYVMADAGFLNRDPRYLLAHYKFLMRLPVNAILDQDFHTGSISRSQAMELMTQTAFQEEREAAAKWVRMQLSSAQLPVYFVGTQEWKDFRAVAEKRAGFNLKRFHDAALSHGSPPVRFIRQLELGEPIR